MNLAFPLAVYDDRLRRVRAALEAHGLDGAVATMPDTVHWLTGVDSVGYLWPQALVVTRSEGEPRLVTRTTEEPCVRALSWLRSVCYYDIAEEDPVAVIAAQVREAGLARGAVGFDMATFALSPLSWDRLRALLPEVTWHDTSDLVPEVRLVKRPDEIALQERAARIADLAVEAVFAAVRPGVSELELAGVAAAALGAAGGEHAAIPPMVVTGERSALVHAMASRRTVGYGDLVCVELAGVVNRYHAVVMRTAVLGEPSPRVREVAACLERATAAAIGAAVPGAPVRAPDEACNAVLAELGLVSARCHRIGYSVGVAYPPGWLEPMTLVEGDGHVLTPGMSFTIEPNLSLAPEGFGLKTGDTVLCTSEGARSLSGLDHALRIID